MQNKLPQGWTECELGDVCNLDNGSKIYNVNLPLLDVKYLRGKKEASIAKQGVLLNNGDFVILVDGENSGEIFSIYEQGVMGSTFKKLIFSDYVNVDFVKFKIKSKQKMFKLHKVGSAIPHLNKKLFKTIQLLLPPLNEQKRIAEKIESEFKKIDEGLEHLEKAKEQIKQYRQSVLKFAFEGKLYKVSEWQSCKLKDFCLPIKKRKISNSEQEEFFYIDISSIDNKNNILLSATKYNGKNAPSRARQIVKAKDILFSTVRTYLKNIAMVTPEYDNEIASTGFCVIRANSNLLDSKFMFYKSLSNNFLKPLNKMQRGSSYPAVRDKDVLSQIVSVPHYINEQQKIVEEIEKRFAVADEVEKVVEENIEKAKQLKQSILKKAFEGRLVPQDPTDEPASILLEKIKQEREKNERK